jgi:hypothetical protein
MGVNIPSSWYFPEWHMNLLLWEKKRYEKTFDHDAIAYALICVSG